MRKPEILGTDVARPCPFCGAQPHIEPWHGGGPRKRLVGCSNDYCPFSPGACESTRRRAIDQWNTRDGSPPFMRTA